MTTRRRVTKKRLVSAAVIITVALLVLVLRLVEEIGPERLPGDRFLVARIVDGDTMELQGGDRLRLLSLDTPEKGEPFYNEATLMVQRLALGHEASLEFAKTRRDKYGRLLGYLYIDTLFINKAIIDSGYGYLYLFSDNELNSDRVRLMLEAQRSAMARGVGLWSLSHEPEEFYINKDGSFRLHRPSCASVSKLVPGRYRTFSTREEGLALGLSPCRNCKP